MPFGLCNSNATFERLIDDTLHGLKWYICRYTTSTIAWFFSPDFTTLLLRLILVFMCLTNAGLQLEPEKCPFAAQLLTILGHTVSNHGVIPDTANLYAVAEFQQPTNIKEIR